MSDKHRPASKSFLSRFKKQPDVDEPPTPPTVKFHQLFRYTNTHERLLMFAAVASAAVHGALLPCFTIFFGGIINAFDPDISDDELLNEIQGPAVYFLILGAIAFVTSLIQVRLQLIVAQRTSARLRRMFFRSLLSQDFTWYDHNDGGELTARVANDVNVIQNGIGDKITSAVQFIFTFIVGIIIAFVYGPLLTLVVLSVAPLLIIGGMIFGKLAADSTGDGLGAYGQAGGIASEVLGLIRTVYAFNGQKSEIARYKAALDEAYKANVRQAVIGGLGLGFTMFVIFCSYSISFTFGAHQVRSGKLEAGDILTTFFSVIIACVSIGQGTSSRSFSRDELLSYAVVHLLFVSNLWPVQLLRHSLLSRLRAVPPLASLRLLRGSQKLTP